MNATKRACDFLKVYGLQVLKEVSITVSHSAHDCTAVWIPVYVSSVSALFAPENNVWEAEKRTEKGTIPGRKKEVQET